MGKIELSQPQPTLLHYSRQLANSKYNSNFRDIILSVCISFYFFVFSSASLLMCSHRGPWYSSSQIKPTDWLLTFMFAIQRYIREGFKKRTRETWVFGWALPDPFPPPNLGPVIGHIMVLKKFIGIFDSFEHSNIDHITGWAPGTPSEPWPLTLQQKAQVILVFFF